jgi:hypothetical protein
MAKPAKPTPKQIAARRREAKRALWEFARLGNKNAQAAITKKGGKK